MGMNADGGRCRPGDRVIAVIGNPRGLTAENSEIAEELGWCERGKKTSHRNGRKLIAEIARDRNVIAAIGKPKHSACDSLLHLATPIA
jgi:hypothetical protein